MSGRKQIVKAIIAAGGEGKRLGTTLPKQFLRIAGKTVLENAIIPFQEIDEISEIIVVLPRRYLKRYFSAITGKYGKVACVVPGGKMRFESVENGIKAAGDASIYLIHDGVRPLVSRELIKKVLAETKRCGAAIAAIKVNDTVKEVDRKRFILKTLKRDKLYLAQTPQGFRADVLGQIMKTASKEKREATDESSLAERLGFKVSVVEGEGTNLKVTSLSDLHIAELFMRSRERKMP
ncbi:MAG: 2-C-methyl-D-erythritol 4-phosphate cytidylyltransferase [Acidobacteriota bacterium]